MALPGLSESIRLDRDIRDAWRTCFQRNHASDAGNERAHLKATGSVALYSRLPRRDAEQDAVGGRVSSPGDFDK